MTVKELITILMELESPDVDVTVHGEDIYHIELLDMKEYTSHGDGLFVNITL